MELWLRETVFNFVSVVMRVPPLFLLDELLRIGLGVADEPNTEYNMKMSDSQTDPYNLATNLSGNSVSFNNQNWSVYNLPTSYTIYTYQMYAMTTLKFLACCFGCVAAICTFMLHTKHLILVYFYLISLGVVFVSYWSNVSTVDAVVNYLSLKDISSLLTQFDDLQFRDLMFNGLGSLMLLNFILQSVLAQLFCFVHLGSRHTLLKKLICFSFTVPTYISLLPLSAKVMTESALFAALVPLSVCVVVLCYSSKSIWRTIYRGYQTGRTFISNYGVSVLAEAQWRRLHVPSVLRIFWLLRVAEQVAHMLLIEDTSEEGFNYYNMVKTLLVNGCETLTAVLGMTSVISVICHYIGSFFHWVLLIDEEDEKSIGAVSAMLFYILALQTGLTSLDKENRLLRLCRNLCLLFTAVLHFVHNIVSPLLMSLSASRNPALHRHVRALAVCLFLIVFPVWLLNFLWSRYTMSTWILAVTVFSIEIVVKVIVSLAIYSLFLYDAYRKNFWDELDDWVYIFRSFGNTIEFAFGIILFFNGFWILVFEAGGTMRACMMCVHAYFNLWCEAKAGWSVFMKRRHAVNKMNCLPDATENQLREHADVCAICYQEMETAKITKCNHFFHGMCLRKWLYVQDMCPLCHEVMYLANNQNKQRESEAPAPEENRQEENNRANAQVINEEINNIMNQNNPQDSTIPRPTATTAAAEREQTARAEIH